MHSAAGHESVRVMNVLVMCQRTVVLCVITTMCAALIGCTTLARTSKSLPELAAFLNQNGIPGSFELRPHDKETKGLVAEGIFTDAVNGKIKSTWCSFYLFSSEEAAKTYATGEQKLSSNGCFCIWVSGVSWQNKNVPYVFSQFKPYQ